MRKIAAVMIMALLCSFDLKAQVNQEYTGIWRAVYRDGGRTVRELTFILKATGTAGRMDIYKRYPGREVYFCTIVMSDQIHFKGEGVELADTAWTCSHTVTGRFENNRIYLSDKQLWHFKNGNMAEGGGEYKFKRWDQAAKMYPDFPKDNMNAVTD